MTKRTKICLIGVTLIQFGFLERFLGHTYINRRIEEAFSGGRAYQATWPWPWYVGPSNDVILLGFLFLIAALAFSGLAYRSKSGEGKWLKLSN